MNVPQHIVDRLEDYLDGNLDQPGHDDITKWCDQSDANRVALAAWFVSQVELFEASRLADMRNVFAGFAIDDHTNGASPAQHYPHQKTWSRRAIGFAIALSITIAGTAGYLWRVAGNKDSGIKEAVSPIVSTSERP